MRWLCRAQDAAGGGGVSGGYYFADGWLPAYPETTGYMIPTFLEYATLAGSPEYRDRAVRMGEWETAIQLPSGAVRGGIGLNEEPIVFNTGQVILGWIELHHATGQDRFIRAAKAAADWLVEIQDPDGKWTRHTHRNVPHAYHSRVAWALLRLCRVTRTPRYEAAALANIQWVLSQADGHAWFAHTGFEPGRPVFTHTIAYTLRGLLEAAAFCPPAWQRRILGVVQTAAETMMLSYERNKPDPLGPPRLLPGMFSEGWTPSGNWSCLTGNAQTALVWMKLYCQTGDLRFLNAGLKILDQVKGTQSLNSLNPGIRGGIAGAYPLWGAYERLGYPNWAAKFFADALMYQERIMRDLGGDCS